jgi:hypothetical protein
MTKRPRKRVQNTRTYTGDVYTTARFLLALSVVTGILAWSSSSLLETVVGRAIGRWASPAQIFPVVEYCVGETMSKRHDVVHGCHRAMVGRIRRGVEFFSEKPPGNDEIELSTDMVHRDGIKILPGLVTPAHHYDLYVASQQHKLMYCAIGKNACTKLRQLFLRLSGHPDWETLQQQLGSVHLKYFEDRRVHFGDMPLEAQEDAISSSDWIRFVMLRDPVERFLSVFLEKGVKSRFPGIELDILLDDPRLQPIRDVVDVPQRYEPTAASLRQYFQLQGIWAQENHHKLQKEFCGFQVLPRTFYNRFFVYSRNVNLDNATAALFDHRVDDEIYHGWAHGSLWASDTSHITRGSSYDRLVAELCADRDTLELVLEYTRPDYEFFGFPPPKICERSTGRERGSKWEDRAADL